MIDQSLVDTALDQIITTLETRAIRLNGLNVDWRSLFEQHRASLRLCETEDAFEERINGVMARSGLSHGAFFRREDPQNVPARLAIAATLRPFSVNGTSRWMFQDVLDGPAHRAGIAPGDLLVAINGKEASPPLPVTLALDRDAILTIDGRDGTRRDVSVTFPRAGAPGHGQAEGTPPLIKPRSVTATRLDSETGYLRVAFFPGASGREFANSLTKAFAELGPCDKLAIDVRGNNGGFVGYLRLASYLTPKRLPIGYSLTKSGQDEGLTRESVKRLRRIPDGRLGEIWMFARFQLREKDRRNRSVSLWTERLGPQPFHGRIVMLVNEHTFSAAENLAAFASEERLATLLGTKTAGQTNGGANHVIAERFTLRVPATVWHTWRGTSYEGKGITPDIVIEQSLEDLRAGVDTQLEKAKALLRNM